MKKLLFPAALLVAVLALPAPAQKLRAELRTGDAAAHSAPLRLSLGYRFAMGGLFALDMHGGMIIGGAQPIRFTGGISLR